MFIRPIQKVFFIKMLILLFTEAPNVDKDG